MKKDFQDAEGNNDGDHREVDRERAMGLHHHRRQGPVSDRQGRKGQTLQPRRKGRSEAVRLHLDHQRERGLRDDAQPVRRRN